MQRVHSELIVFPFSDTVRNIISSAYFLVFLSHILEYVTEFLVSLSLYLARHNLEYHVECIVPPCPLTQFETNYLKQWSNLFLGSNVKNIFFDFRLFEFNV